ncbi:MAG: hypothetical protein CVU17_04835 [Betaproteobacteria bacterium HGW-Betaproteobacteria-11]|nr:MAG: hypothetical protein CVU17_04835 [Betaproteobacteria bacterium HGW-Betaproteobacteria-11]
MRRRAHARFVLWALRGRPPEAAPILLDQRRVYVLPTRGGLAFAFTLAVIMLGAMNYNLSLGYALVFLLAGLGVVTILHSFRNLVQLSLRPGHCEPVFAGTPAAFTLILENARPEKRSGLRLFVTDGIAAPVELDVPAGGFASASLQQPTQRRGWLACPRITIETTWPLGLIRAWSYAAPEARCLVYPAPAAKAPPLPWQDDFSRDNRREGRGSDDFSGLRNHQAADPLRHVAWKAAARQEHGPLLTKLFAGSSAQQLLIDWEATTGLDDAEQRLSILTRWMLDAEAGGVPWALHLPGLRLATDHGSVHLAKGLAALALFGYGTP